MVLTEKLKEFAEEFRPLFVGDFLLVFDLRPFAVSGHINYDVCNG